MTPAVECPDEDCDRLTDTFVNETCLECGRDLPGLFERVCGTDELTESQEPNPPRLAKEELDLALETGLGDALEGQETENGGGML